MRVRKFVVLIQKQKSTHQVPRHCAVPWDSAVYGTEKILAFTELAFLVEND